MDDLITVLIVDDNMSLCRLVESNLNNIEGIKTVGIASDGVCAIEMIRKDVPDVILLDVIMPNLDGLGVLEWLSGEEFVKRPVVVVFTAIGGDAVIQRAMELGADYYMMKPIDLSLLASRIIQLCSERISLEEYYVNTSVSTPVIQPVVNPMEKIISSLILNMGITPNLAGYNYIREAVLLVVEDPERLKSVSSNIYPELAQRHNSNIKSIDRAIRCAVSSAKKKVKNVGEHDNNECIMINGKKPGSAQIIGFLAEKAVREYKKIR